MIKRLEWVGSVTGLLFAFLIAFGVQPSFLFALVSNVTWLTVGVKTNCKPMVYMQIGFGVSSIIGIYNWLGV